MGQIKASGQIESICNDTGGVTFHVEASEQITRNRQVMILARN